MKLTKIAPVNEELFFRVWRAAVSCNVGSSNEKQINLSIEKMVIAVRRIMRKNSRAATLRFCHATLLMHGARVPKRLRNSCVAVASWYPLYEGKGFDKKGFLAAVQAHAKLRAAA